MSQCAEGRDRLAEEDRWRKEQEERAAAEALRRMPLREQLPPLLEPDPPPPANTVPYVVGRTSRL
ncbi:hypothetical protein [Streptomyces hirsutus]|uniref:hypothetical protein n=1 Tax=Streptomyces hirsutus TaxID=35620 RepID=UPI003655FB90